MRKSWSVKGGRLGWVLCGAIGPRAALLLGLVFAFGTSFTGLAQEPQRIPGQRQSQIGSVAGRIRDQNGKAVGGASVQLQVSQGQRSFTAVSDGEGIYRVSNIAAGEYRVTVTADGFTSATTSLSILPTKLQVLDLQLQLSATPSERSPGPVGIPGAPRTAPLPAVEEADPFGSVRMPQPESPPELGPVEIVPEESDNFASEPYRWTVEMPAWQRYGKSGEFPYVTSHWYDPFNRNRLKADFPIFGQRWFLDFTGTSLTQVDVRRLPTPSGISAEQPGSYNFFGKGE